MEKPDLFGSPLKPANFGPCVLASVVCIGIYAKTGSWLYGIIGGFITVFIIYGATRSV